MQPPFVSLTGHTQPSGEILAGSPLAPTPAAYILDSDQKPLLFGDNVVFVSVVEISQNPRNFPPLELSGRVSEFSCCRASNCAALKQKMEIECDCSHKDAALCAVPRMGVAYFHNISVNKVGTFQLAYHHTEIMLSSSGDSVTYTARDSGGFTVIPGPADSLAVVDQPGSSAIGNRTGTCMSHTEVIPHMHMVTGVCALLHMVLGGAARKKGDVSARWNGACISGAMCMRG